MLTSSAFADGQPIPRRHTCEGEDLSLDLVAPEHVEAMLDAGAEGAIVSFADETAMRDFARRFR